MTQIPSFRQRVEIARQLVAKLFGNFNATVSSIVADGWPEEMVRAGLSFHRQTWNIDECLKHLQRELYPLGGLEALDYPVITADGAAKYHIIRPRKVIHIWPALPGAGITPVLFGWLLGAKQVVRPSGRSTYFAHHFYEVWESLAGSSLMHLEFGAPDSSWQEADIIVVSGKDETIDAIQDFVMQGTHRTKIIGYGHRISFATIVDDPTLDVQKTCKNIALDTVLWHQQGCFSPRGVVFCGNEQRAQRFAETLGEQIQKAEMTLQATTLPDSRLALRAQQRGQAEFVGKVHGDGLGWVHEVNTAFEDHDMPHTLTFHRIEHMQQLNDVINVLPHHLQGASLSTAPSKMILRQSWARALAHTGITRVCEAGMLQSPPASWCHDGRLNILDWLQTCSMD